MLKTILSHVKEYKKVSIATPVAMIFEVIFEILIPICMGSIVNEGVNKGNLKHIYTMGVVMVILALLSLLSGILGGVFGAQASAGLAKNLRKSMFDHIQTFSFSNIDKFSTAGLITRLTTDVSNIQNAYQMILRMCFRAPFSMLFAMIAAFIISPKIASIYLVAVLFLATVLFFLIRSTMGYFRRVFEKYDDLNATVQENVGAIRVVKAYVREDYEKSRLEKASESIYNMFVQAENRVIINAPLMQFTVYGCILTISWVGAKLIVNSGGTVLNTGDLMALLAYCMNILMSLMILSMIFVMVAISGASAERVAEVLNEEADIVNPEIPVLKVEDGSIDFEDVDFSYQKGSGTPVLKDVTLHIKSGETIGIIGGTGSAKSSLVNLISRIYDVTQGSVKVGGKDVREYDLKVLRDQVAVVLQKNVLFSGTILDNLRWGNEHASENVCSEACHMACADEFIEAMPDQYNTFIERGGSNLSGGQKQRLCIARALLKNPKILILDDSTSAVDTATDAKIRRAFREDIPGMTKLIIAQRISSVQDADRIIVMDEGRVNGFGTHEELLRSNAIYREVYESQTSGNGDFDSL